MDAAGGNRRMLRATICEIERGVFYATYARDRTSPPADELPTYQVGKSADDAKQRIERSARQLGYDEIWWKESIVVPSFLTHSETTLRQPAPAYAVPRTV
jgi:hypothetical protein